MFFCLDIGNTDVHGGVYDEDRNAVLSFRKANQNRPSADEFGLFCVQVLKENGIDPAAISEVGVASVVPGMNRSTTEGIQKYLEREPMMLTSGIRLGLDLNVRNPAEVGADRIAGALAAVEHFPGEDLIVCDFGTATTFDVIRAEQSYEGGVIAPGVSLSMQALAGGTAKLMSVDIIEPEQVLGKDTSSHIQSGLFFGSLGLTREIVERITSEVFGGQQPKLIATGGFARLLENRFSFDAIIPDLVLRGIVKALLMNRPE
jgi:type III pantothenate kinase